MDHALRHKATRGCSYSHRFRKAGKLIFWAALSFAPFDLAQAQKTTTLPRIGILRPGTPPDLNVDRFLETLRELGYVDGKSAIIELRYAEGRPGRLAELAAELVGQKVDVIYTSTQGAIFALRRATKTIPIIFIGTSDPVAAGIVASLARPGGNVTGVTLMASDLWPKRLELLKEMFPKLSRVAMVWNKGDRGMSREAKATQEAAGPIGVVLQDRGVNDASEIDAIFAAVIKDRPDGFLPLIDPLLAANQKRILDFLAEHRLPSMFESSDWVDAGGLASYGPNVANAIRRTAALIDKVLKGTRPADIPVEQPMKFEFVINLKTAKQIGLTIPPNLLVRADRVIR